MSLNAKDKHSHIAEEVNIVENVLLERIIYFRAHKIGTRSFMLKLDYLMNEQKKSTDSFLLNISVVKPFEITTQFYTMLYEPLTKGFINEPFFMMPHITCTSPWPIKIIGTSIELVCCFYLIFKFNLIQSFALKKQFFNFQYFSLKI